MTVYGLSNCDTTKAALKWLRQQNVSFEFYDLKLKGISEAQIRNWLEKIPLEKLLNKKSTTWRELTPAEQSTAESIDGAVTLIAKNPNLVKRPLIKWPEGNITVGYNEAMFESMNNG